MCACTTSEVYSEREEVRLGRETGLQIFVLSTSLKGALLGFCYACSYVHTHIYYIIMHTKKVNECAVTSALQRRL